MITNIILYVSAYMVIPIMTGCMLYSAKDKKKENRILGIKIPEEQMDSSEIIILLKQFRKEIWLWTLVLGLFPIPACLIPSFSISFFVWTGWMYACIIVPMINYGRTYNKLKSLKKERQWGTTENRSIVVDTKIILDKEQYSYHKWYLPAILLSGIPLVSNFFLTKEIFWVTETIVLASFVIGTIIFYLISFTFRHMRGEIVSCNSTRNANYNRAKIRIWNRFLAWNAYAFAVLTWLIWISLYMDKITIVADLAVLVLYLLFLTMFTLWVVRRLCALRNEIMKEESVELDYEDEEYWIGGMFYYNPNDSHTWIDKKVGVGTTVNMATKVGKAFTVFTVLCLLSVPCIGVFMALDEYTPITLAYENNEISVSHVFTHYTIEKNDLESVELIHQLPDRRRVGGTAIDTLEKGNFKVDEYGRCKLLLQTDNQDFLLFETISGKTYIISGENDTQTDAVYQELMEK